jgi:3-methyladenine DNA glycosylase AlkC
MVTKLSDVSDVLGRARRDPRRTFPEILKLASSEDWKEREVAASILMEASKKWPGDIVGEMNDWAEHSDPNVRRTASEGLRDVARKNPQLVLPVLAKMKADESLYVRKSVANVLRNAGNYHPEFVFRVCTTWGTAGNPHTAWIIRDGLKKLRIRFPEDVEKITAAMLAK